MSGDKLHPFSFYHDRVRGRRGINGIEFHKKLPPKLGHIPGGLTFLEFFLAQIWPPGQITF